MSRSTRYRSGVLLLLLAMTGCTLSTSPGEEKTPPATGQTSVPPTNSPQPPISPPALTPFPTLETVTDPFANQANLLDGVCFEFLQILNGTTWVWSSPGELETFYDQADASGLCPGLVARGTFAFENDVLVGAVSVTTGCDAAHRIIDLAQDDSAHIQVLVLQLIVQPGCPYELVQPFLAAIPRPPDGYTIRVELTDP